MYLWKRLLYTSKLFVVACSAVVLTVIWMCPQVLRLKLCLWHCWHSPLFSVAFSWHLNLTLNWTTLLNYYIIIIITLLLYYYIIIHTYCITGNWEPWRWFHLKHCQQHTVYNLHFTIAKNHYLCERVDWLKMAPADSLLSLNSLTVAVPWLPTVVIMTKTFF